MRSVCKGRWRRRQGDEEPAASDAVSMELARLAGEPLTVGKEVSLGEPGRISSADSKLRTQGKGGRKEGGLGRERGRRRKAQRGKTGDAERGRRRGGKRKTSVLVRVTG